MGSRKLAPVLLLTSMTFVAGCGSMSEKQAQGGGALAGGVAGAAACKAAGCGPGGTLLAAIAGAAVGWGTVKVYQSHAEKTRGAGEEADALGYSPTDGTVVQFRGAGVEPEHVMEGHKLKLAMEYTVLAPTEEREISVTEKWSILKDGKKLIDLNNEEHVREQGRWRSTMTVKLPEGIDAGTYIAQSEVNAGSQYDRRPVPFYVNVENVE